MFCLAHQGITWMYSIQDMRGKWSGNVLLKLVSITNTERENDEGLLHDICSWTRKLLCSFYCRRVWYVYASTEYLLLISYDCEVKCCFSRSYYIHCTPRHKPFTMDDTSQIFIYFLVHGSLRKRKAATRIK